MDRFLSVKSILIFCCFLSQMGFSIAVSCDNNACDDKRYHFIGYIDVFAKSGTNCTEITTARAWVDGFLYSPINGKDSFSLDFWCDKWTNNFWKKIRPNLEIHNDFTAPAVQKFVIAEYGYEFSFEEAWIKPSGGWLNFEVAKRKLETGVEECRARGQVDLYYPHESLLAGSNGWKCR